MKTKSAIIFDFDGTIADTQYILGQILNELADEYNYPKGKKENISLYRNKSAKQFIKEDLKMSWLRLPGFIRRIKSELIKKRDEVEPFPEIIQAIKELKFRGYLMYIVSSSSEETISEFLKKNNLNIFNLIFSGSSLFGKHRNIKRVLKREKLEEGKVIYVGDEIRDIDAAKKSGIDIIAVSWGFNSRESLIKNNGDCIIDSPSQLLDLLPPVKIN